MGTGAFHGHEMPLLSGYDSVTPLPAHCHRYRLAQVPIPGIRSLKQPSLVLQPLVEWPPSKLLKLFFFSRSGSEFTVKQIVVCHYKAAGCIFDKKQSMFAGKFAFHSFETQLVKVYIHVTPYQ